MRVRLPLYGKILTWFFLNLVIVSAVVAALFTAQFRFTLDWIFFNAGARERLEAVRDLIIGELETTFPDDWEQVLQRYNEAYKVRFAVFDDDAAPLVGGFAQLPPEVRRRIVERMPQPIPPRRDASVSPPPTPSAIPQRFGDGQRRWWPRPPIRALMRTEDPTRYWLLASGRLENVMLGDPMRIVLVAQSNTISAGGLILDPRPWLALALGIVLFSLLFWWPLVGSITRTVRRMMQTTRQIADGRFDVRVNLQRRDELGSLAESIDQMAGRLDGLVTGQKRFLGDIAHELCSPLARLQMALGILEQRVNPEQAPFVHTAAEKAQQISALVAELLSFSKASFGSSAVRLQAVPLRATVAEAVHREQTGAADLHVAIPDEWQVSADPELLLRALSNLLRNAIQHAGAAGPITVEATRSGEEVTIIVADQGPGVPEDELAKIFDAFYRLDTSRTRDTGGTGLGLAIVKTCIDSCCGTVAARNRQPSGLEVRITLHAHEEPVTPATA